MYCTNCGKPIPNDSGFCENCGAKVSTPQSENVQSQTAVPKAESSQNETTTPETESSQNETAAPKANGQPAAAAEKKAKFFTPGKIALYVLALLAVVLLIWGIVSAASHSDKTAAEPTAQAQNAEPLQYTLETGAVIKEFDDWHLITPETNAADALLWGVDSEEFQVMFESGEVCACLVKSSGDRIAVWAYEDNMGIPDLDELPSVEDFAQNMAKGAESLGLKHVSYEIHKVNDIPYVRILGNYEYNSVVEENTVVYGNTYIVDYQYDSSSGITVEEAKNTLQKFLSNITY